MHLGDLGQNQRNQSPRRYLGIVGKIPCVLKSNRLHVVMFQFFFVWSELQTVYSSKQFGNVPKVLNFNHLFLKHGWFIYN